MFFNASSYGYLVLLAALLLSPFAYAESAAVTLKAKPQQCVVLHEGQMCKKTINLFWRAATAKNYCLWVGNQKQPLQCWKTAKQGEFQYSFDANNSLPFYLIEDQQTSAAAEVVISVAWVYEAKRESRATWRLF